MHMKSGRTICIAFLIGHISTAAFGQNAGIDSHITIENPADLAGPEASAIYDDLKDRLATNYAMSQLKEIEDYQSWPLFNTAPYISATHGQRYVNNYANAVASNYADLEEGELLPTGSILVKDSITVTDDGGIFPGALFGMEKLASGASPETADWRYFMVIPDGSIYGDTTGANPDLMTYCHVCHKAVADRDYTFYVPEDFRLTQ
ncbi:cytochrome P460 family protein [Roseibium porphyridii]|uniref:Cytochrome P460 family protein n=1 Tax=Roseibium porphyridii TaxID=2866279 RepID=A0ABY8F4Q2_9HYPH|nr:cytochrome P460 family protein [Roseibium sp. KMA01]WFE90475.1 cytochrome P460 family protein [Roseibium sp. KMA01]